MDDLALMLPTPAEPPLGEYEVFDRGLSGKQFTVTYENGFGASVIQGPYSYGGPEGRYELAVLHGETLCYATPITSDVVGWLDALEVVKLLHQIARLAPNEDCSHSRADSFDYDTED